MSATTAARGAQRSIDGVSPALLAIAAGEAVVVIGHAGTGVQAVLTMPAASVSADDVTRTAALARGVVCAAATSERLDELGIPPLRRGPSDAPGSGLRIGVDHRDHLDDAMAAAARARTLRALADPSSRAADFSVPGRLFSFAARDGGVLSRATPVEAAVDLARIAGFAPVALLCEIVGDDGALATTAEAERWARHCGLSVVAVDDLVRFRLDRDALVRRVVETALPLTAGPFRAIGYESVVGTEEHVALVLGNPSDAGAPRHLHRRCGGEALALCGCRATIDRALADIAAAGAGALVVLSGGTGPSAPTPPRCAASDRPGEMTRLQAATARSIFRDLGLGDAVPVSPTDNRGTLP